MCRAGRIVLSLCGWLLSSNVTDDILAHSSPMINPPAGQQHEEMGGWLMILLCNMTKSEDYSWTGLGFITVDRRGVVQVWQERMSVSTEQNLLNYQWVFLQQRPWSTTCYLNNL